MIEETLMKSLEHAPALLAMVIIVYFFLKFLKVMMEANSKRTDEFIATVKEMHKESAETTARSVLAMQENIRTTAVNTEALLRCTRALEEHARK